MFDYFRRLSSSLKNQILTGDIRKWVIVGILIGIIAGVGAIVIYFSIKLFTYLMIERIGDFIPPSSGISGGEPGFPSPAVSLFVSPYRLLIPLSTVIGGLATGFIVYRFAPETEGHGTDAAIDAFHNKDGHVRRRVPVVKTVASAITIGSGGSAGREGPTAQIAAGFGSFIADVLHLSNKDRRIAVAAGIGAGIGSIFLAPLGGALLSTEILYRKDFEVDALVPSIIASVVGYSIFGFLFDYRPLFTLPANVTIGFYHPSALLVYTLIGIIAGLAGIAYVKVFYGLTEAFHKLEKVPRMLKPAIGGLIVGLIAMYFPEVLGLGYGWIQQIFYTPEYFPLWILLVLILLKIVATSFTIGSGGSGGVFAPGMVIGGFVGAAIGLVIQPFFPFLNVLEITIVGMIAFFGGVSKAPLSIIIMGTEMTQSYTLFLPLMLATMIAYFVTGKNGIYRSQVTSRADSPAHRYEYEKPILDSIKVADAQKRDYVRVEPSTNVGEAIFIIRQSKTKSAVVQEDGILRGLISTFSIKNDTPLDTKVSELMDKNPMTISESESVHRAMEMLINNEQGKLIVVSAANPERVTGTIGFPEIAEAYNMEIRRIKENQRKEGGS